MRRSRASRLVRRLLIGAYFVAQPVLKPALRATVGRNERLWRRLESVRDRLVSGSSLPAGLDAPLHRRLYTGIFLIVGTPVRWMLKNTVGRNRRLWRQIRGIHKLMIDGAPGETWSPDPALRISQRGIRRQPFGVNLAGYLTSEKGTGEAARSAAAILQAAEVPLALNNLIDSGSANLEMPTQELTNANPYAFNLVYVNGDQAANFAFHKGRPYFEGRYNIGAWNWELTSFPEEWMPRFQYFDEIWAPTSFTRDALLRNSPIPVATVPYAVMPPAPTILPRSHFGLPEDEFVFLFMFDYHSVLERKNPLGLIEAFKRAFTPSEAATLVIKSSHADKGTIRMLRETAHDARIIVTDEVLSRGQIGALYHLCDCYVSLHRSEGFGLTPAEAMAMGKPVIATGYGGNTDFMTDDNSYLVRYKLIELDRHYPPYEKGWVWADPDVDHAAELMRSVYNDRAHAEAVGKTAAADISRLLGIETVGRAMRERLKAIANQIGIAMPQAGIAGAEARSLRRREAI